jgi:hypothetical protein
MITGKTDAQVSVSPSPETPPMWGPIGYSHAKYYYLPDVEAYYDITKSMFIYLDGDTWIYSSTLPETSINCNLYKGYKVVLSGYRGTTPFTNFNSDSKRYAVGFRGVSQRTYRQDSAPSTDNGAVKKDDNNEGAN